MLSIHNINRILKQGDTVHGIKYGSLAGSGFISSKDSGVTMICGPCGNMLLKLLYVKYEQAKPSYPAMFKVYEELSSCVKNG